MHPLNSLARLASRHCYWSIAVVLIALLGCQPAAPTAVDPALVIENSKQGVREAEAVIAAVKETDSATKIAAKSDPLKDVVPPGPVVPYFNPLTVEETAEGWISLFDGHSLFGWESNDKGVNWSVADGSITADAGPKGLLLTYTPFADYQFRCDFQMAPEGNSGVFLRSTATPKDVQKDCYEINIVDEHPAGFLTGAIVGLQKTAQPIKGSGGWHTFLLTANGTKITVALDGKEVAAYDDTRPEARRTGFIGLQKNEGKIEFKNIALKPLNQKPLFNGKDLAGWRVVPGSKGEFTFEEGTIHVKGGEGFLESETQHKDFVLQAQAKTNPHLYGLSYETILDEAKKKGVLPDHSILKGTNTGIFLRAETGTEKAKSNGYEVQIENGFGEGPDIPDNFPFPNESATDECLRDVMIRFRGPPTNAGTGAIFRRVNARRVVSTDARWCTMTLIASGPRISTFVDGYAVVHWEDTRKPDPNPRKGQRLDAGHFSLQGHDPTTDASFRAFTVSDQP